MRRSSTSPSTACRRNRWGSRQRRLHGDPADARAGLRQRFHLRRPRQARHDAGGCAVSHGPDALQPSSTRRAPTAAPGSATPAMIPLSNVVHGTWDTSSPSLTRYNGYSAIEIVGSPAAGHALRRGDERDDRTSSRNDLPHGLRLRLDRPVAAGDALRQRGAAAARRCRSSSCSCASPRCTRAGRSRSRCCWSCRSGLLGAVAR